MMKKRVLSLLSVLSLVAMLAMPTIAADTTGTVLYEEDFESGTIAFMNQSPENDGTCSIVEENGNKFLQLVTNTFESENGYLHFWGPYAEDGETLQLNMTGDWDYTLRVRPDYIKNPDHNWAKICVNAQDGLWENACYMFEMWQWRGKIAVKDNANGLNDLNNAFVEGMENENYEFNDGIWYDLKISRRGNKISVYVNDILNVYMTDNDARWDGGTIVFCSWGANFSVDDLKVVGYEGDGPDPTPVVDNGDNGGDKDNTAGTTTGNDDVAGDDAFVFPVIPVVIAVTAVILVGGAIVIVLVLQKQKNERGA